MVDLKKCTTFGYDFNCVKDDLNSDGNIARAKKILLLEYLDREAKTIKKNGDFYVSAPGNPGLSFMPGLIGLFGEGSLFENAIGYLLSSDRLHSPVDVSSFDKKYDWIEDVLRSERGNGARLTRGIAGWVSNVRSIKYGE